MNLMNCPQPLRGGLLLLVLLAAIGSPSLRAAGSPPMITDDPGTPGDGHWEINLGVSTERRPGSRVSELPLFDINYGIGDRLQLKYEVPYLRLNEADTSSESGFGNSEVGIKWRFLDDGDSAMGFAVSVYPQLEFNNPGSNADARGLVGQGTVLLLPFQFERAIGAVTAIGQIGHEFRPAGDGWFYGVSMGRHVSDRVELAVELAGGASAGFHRSHLTANFGVVVDLSERHSILFSVGRELHNHDEPRAGLVGYLGLQWRL